MTNNPRASLHPLSQSKANPTTSTSKASTLSAPSRTSPVTSHPPSRPSSRIRQSRPPPSAKQLDATTDKATTALIRRVLCQQANSHASEQRTTLRPLHELLPPLTSSNEVDLQLYAIIAIIIKEFVQAWYSKITPDHVFVDEVLQVIAHCTRALEGRLRGVDVDALVLDEIPGLIERHIISYRTAQQREDTAPFRSPLRKVYHTLNSHPALSPVPDPSDHKTIEEQRENEEAYRQLLARGALAVLLPTEDLENTCLRTLVGDILADLILGEAISGKACEGWFIWKAISGLITVIKNHGREKINRKESESTPESRLQKFGLVQTKAERENERLSKRGQSRASIWMWRILQYGYIAFMAIRFVIVGLFEVASSSPSTTSNTRSAFSSTPTTPITHGNETLAWPMGGGARRPVLRYRVFGLVSQILNLSKRMPWIAGMAAFMQHTVVAGPGNLGEADGILDRFLHEIIQNHLLTPTFLPIILLATRTALFPANARPGPNSNANPIPDAPQNPITDPDGVTTSNHSQRSSASRDTSKRGPSPSSAASGRGGADNMTQSEIERPSDPEIATIKRDCAASILSLIPRPVARSYFQLSTPTVVSTTSPPTPSIITDSGMRKRSPCPSPSLDQTHTSTQTQNPIPNIVTAANTTSSSTPSSSTPPPSLSASSFTETAGPGSSVAVDEEEELILSAIEHDILDLFADKYCNKHLVYAIIETVLVKLLPEMAEQGVAEMMAERGVV
ncbi:hypothetical protein FQN54_003631 [Arachnomyces sp. PD_36]|nr:hypothetical protein FQN54_003631 [Arachnomyces sp. PD_36]